MAAPAASDTLFPWDGHIRFWPEPVLIDVCRIKWLCSTENTA